MEHARRIRLAKTNRPEPEWTAWLAQTKLQPPLLRSDVIPRRRLIDELREVLYSHQLTLVSAPAGYGKTTLLASVPHAFSDLPQAWLSLDEEDNDPARFFGALVAALRRLNPACGVNTEILLSNLDDPGSEARRVVGTLINEVFETMQEPFALVLDDLHVITEPRIHAALDYLIERLPSQMHLAVATRSHPPLALSRCGRAARSRSCASQPERKAGGVMRQQSHLRKGVSAWRIPDIHRIGYPSGWAYAECERNST